MLDVFKDSQIIDSIPSNGTIYKYRFYEKECKTYQFAVYAINDAGTSATSTDISVAVPDGE